MLVASHASPDASRQLAGRYYAQFPDSTIDGDKYIGENIVEIVPVASRAAYVRVHLDFYNGHVCSIYGVAAAEDNSLVYHDPKPHFEGKMCTLRVKRSGKSLQIDDGESSCSSYCGARGSLTDVALPYASKRAIGYLPRLKSSSEYRQALAEWRRDKQ